MKQSILLGASLAIMGLAIAPAIAQTQSTTTSTTTSYIQSTAVVGAKIKDSQGEEIGVIRDFVLDRNTGCLAYVVISTGKGGVLTTSKTVAAPWAVFSVSADPKVYVTRIEKERIYSAPVWESTRVEEYSRTEYLNNVYSYYGVPAPRFNAEMSMGVTNTTTTGNTSTTTATAAPSMTAAPPGGTSPSPVATAAASPLGTPIKTAPPPSSPAGASSPKAPAHTHTHSPAKETSSPPSTKTESVREKKPTDEPEKKSEKASTKKESASEKSESAGESPGHPKKKQHSEHGSEPEAASTPKAP